MPTAALLAVVALAARGGGPLAHAFTAPACHISSTSTCSSGGRWRQTHGRVARSPRLVAASPAPARRMKPLSIAEAIDDVSTEVPGGDNNTGTSPASPDRWDRLNHAIENWLGSSLLLFATVVSIGLANSQLSSQWLGLWAQKSGLVVGHHAFTIKDVVNEGFMALFFFHVGLEIKKEIVDGSLSSFKSALMPCIAALGGMAIPMLVYASVNLALPAGTMAAITVPMATDIAFAMGVFNVFRARLPPAVASFLLTLATVDDLGAIAVIATCFAKSVSFPFLAAAAAVQGGLVALERRKVQRGRPFLALGLALWYCLLRAGVNADVAGVLTGLCVFGSKGNVTGLERLIKRWTPISALLVMPLFALANTAIPLSFGGGANSGPAGCAALGIFAGLILGKPLGIFGASWLASKFGVAQLPQGMTKRHLSAVGVLGSIGFTMCIFLIEQCMPGSASQAKIAIMAASLLGAGVSALLLQRIASAGGGSKSLSASKQAPLDTPMAA